MKTYLKDAKAIAGWVLSGMWENAIYILFVLMAIIVIVIGIKTAPATYTNMVATIVSVGSEEGESQDKFRKPTIFYSVIAQDVTDSTHFVLWEPTMEQYYNYEIGDTLHWESILKSKWFHKY